MSKCVDDAGTIHVHWENGSLLGIIYAVDKCLKVINDEKKKKTRKRKEKIT